MNKKADSCESPKQWNTTKKFEVQWADLDGNQHVNNVVFIRWFQEGRIEYLMKLMKGASSTDRLRFILAETSCKYLKPVFWPDFVILKTRVKSIGSSSVAFEYSAWSETQNAEVATGIAVMVCFDYSTQRTSKLTEQFVKKLEEVERRTLTNSKL